LLAVEEAEQEDQYNLTYLTYEILQSSWVGRPWGCDWLHLCNTQNL